MSDSASKISYRQLLRENPDFRKLFYAQTVSTMGDWFHTVALLTLVYAMTESGLMVSFTLITKALPVLLFSPFAGVLADRADRKKIMIYTNVFSGLAVLFMLLAQNFIWVIFVVNVIMALLNTLFNPARQAVVPLVVPKEQLALANTLSSTVWGMMSILGASLGGLIAEWFGTNAAFLIDSATFFLAAFFVMTATIPKVESNAAKRSFFGDMKEGYRFVLKSPIILVLILVGASWGIVGGAYQVLLTFFGMDVFEAGKNGVGLLYAIQGLGVLLGGLLVKKFVSGSDRRMKQSFGWAYLGQGVFFVLFALAPNIWFGLAFLMLMRIAGGVIIPLDSTLIQKYTPQDMIGKVFTLHGSLYIAIMQFSMFITGYMLNFMSPRTIGVIFGLICCVVSLSWLIMYYTKRLDGPVQPPVVHGEAQSR